MKSHKTAQPDYSSQFEIVVNGETGGFCSDDQIQFEWLVLCAFPKITLPSLIRSHTVTWCDPETGENGSLTQGEGVPAKNGLVFNVSRTTAA